MLYDTETRLLIARERAELLRAEATTSGLRPARSRRPRSWKRTSDAILRRRPDSYEIAVSVSGSKK